MNTHDEALYTRADLASKLKTPVSTVEYLHRKNDWPHVKVGKHIRYTGAQVEQIVRDHTVVPAKKDTTKPALHGQTSRSAASKKAVS